MKKTDDDDWKYVWYVGELPYPQIIATWFIAFLATSGGLAWLYIIIKITLSMFKIESVNEF